MSTTIDPSQVIGHKVLDAEGHKIGQAEEVYLDDSTGDPQWVTVKGGLFGGKEHFAPLGGASLVEDDLRLACAKSQVDSAPYLESGHHLSVEEERALYRHYGLGQREMSAEEGGAGRPGTAEAAAVVPGTIAPDLTSRHRSSATGAEDTTTAGRAPLPESDLRNGAMEGAGMGGTRRTGAGMDGAGMGTADPRTADLPASDLRAPDERTMTRFEERLHVSTERVETGHARLHKYVTTEQVEQTVPLTHQEVRIEREPILDGSLGTGTDTGIIAEAEQDVPLFQERTVVTKETVPVERVRVRVEEVTEDVTVLEDVRKERIELEGDDTLGPEGRMRK